MADQLQRAEAANDSVIYTAQIEGERIGKAEGKAEERLAIARNLLEMGMPISDISRCTGALEDEIKKLTH